MSDIILPIGDPGGGPLGSARTFSLLYETTERLHPDISLEDGGEIIIKGNIDPGYDREAYAESSPVVSLPFGNTSKTGFRAIYEIVIHQNEECDEKSINIRLVLMENYDQLDFHISDSNKHATEFKTWRRKIGFASQFQIAIGCNSNKNIYWGSTLDSSSSFKVEGKSEKKSWYITYRGGFLKPVLGQVVQIQYNTGTKRKIGPPLAI